MSVYQKIHSLNITLPPLTAPVAAFVPFVRSGNLLFISGHIAKSKLLGTLEAAVGDLNNIRRIVKLMVLVNSAPTFTEQPLVANGASELLIEVFGEKGRHTRAAFGVAQVPYGSCLEIDLLAEISDGIR